jgi:gamma-glutamyltranspeptidase/glutathione hydrolase
MKNTSFVVGVLIRFTWSRFAWVALLSIATLAYGADQSSVNSSDGGRIRPVVGMRGMVVSDDRIASEWGAEILRRGGNAVDAAVGTAFMLSVTRPYYGSLGGGGFLVYCPAQKKCTTLDYREMAPKGASRDMYIRDGKAQTDLSQNGALASGVPGVTAGLLKALEKYGHKSRQEILREPIRVAKTGFRVTGKTEAGAKNRWEHMNAEARKLLGCSSSAGAAAIAATVSATTGSDALRPCVPGTLLRQPDLAHILGAISDRGIKGFYRGWVAQKIVDGVRSGGGIFTLEDLYAYHPVERAPMRGNFKIGDSGFEVISMAPPSSGGFLLLQLLGYTDRAQKQGLYDQGFASVASIHAMAHAMALSFADRAGYLGDPDFLPEDRKDLISKLLSPGYLDSRWATFDPSKARIPEAQGNPGGSEGHNTTHFSVVDSQGNAVAVTTTINDEYGSGFVPPGTGIFMNNEMDDFSIQPGTPNLFGLVGGEANAIAPGKRPLSSMTPTIVRDEKGFPRFVLGGAGGPRIPTGVYNVLMNRLVFGMTLPDAVDAARVHEQWKPSEILLERYGFASEVRSKLKSMGYVIQEGPAFAKLHALERFPDGRVWGVADPRGEGAAVAE